MSDVIYTCDKCPRTFKLQEFYDKHKLVHDLKKQHVCHLCGFVYGAAKGLEGHLKTHAEETEAKPEEEKQPDSQAPLNITFLNPRGVLSQASSSDSQTGTVGSQDASKNGNGSLLSSDSKSYDISGTTYFFHIGKGRVFKLLFLCFSLLDCLPEASESSGAVQNESGFFMCNICTREFSGLNSLKKHIPIHTRKVQVKKWYLKTPYS
jgi:uncharacterized Zn-finger protein